MNTHTQTMNVPMGEILFPLYSDCQKEARERKENERRAVCVSLDAALVTFQPSSLTTSDKAK